MYKRQLRERATAATERYHAMGDSIKAAEARLTEIAVLKTHILSLIHISGRTVRDAKRELGDALKSKIVEGRKKVFWME